VDPSALNDVVLVVVSNHTKLRRPRGNAKNCIIARYGYLVMPSNCMLMIVWLGLK